MTICLGCLDQPGVLFRVPEKDTDVCERCLRALRNLGRTQIVIALSKDTRSEKKPTDDGGELRFRALEVE